MTQPDSLSITGGSLTTAAGLNDSGTITVAASCDLAVGGALSVTATGALSLPGAGSPADPATNLLANSDFESPAASGNTTRPGGWNYWGTAYLSTQYAYTGSQSLYMAGGSSGVYQNLAATPGTTYTLSAYAMTPAENPITGNLLAQIDLQFFNSAGQQLSSYWVPNLINVLTDASATGGPLAGSVGGQGWNRFYTSAVAPANSATAEAVVTTYLPDGAGGGSVYWDHVEFGPSLPGPSSLTAASISNGGTITVGPVNTVTTSGNFAQTSTGVLDVQLGGGPASGEFGFVNIGGTATLAGTLKADLVIRLCARDDGQLHAPRIRQPKRAHFATYSLPGNSTYQFDGAVTFTNVVLSAAPAAAATSAIDANANIHAVSTDLLGINLAFWDDQLTTSETQQMVTAAGLNLYRFPGGSASDDFHFNVANNYDDSVANTIAQFAPVHLVGRWHRHGDARLRLGQPAGSRRRAGLSARLAQRHDRRSAADSSGTTARANGRRVNWGTVGYWASLRAASPLATDDGLNFPAHRPSRPVHRHQVLGSRQRGIRKLGNRSPRHCRSRRREHRRRSTTRPPTPPSPSSLPRYAAEITEHGRTAGHLDRHRQRRSHRGQR